jgi:hypothetical protein
MSDKRWDRTYSIADLSVSACAKLLQNASKSLETLKVGEWDLLDSFGMHFLQDTIYARICNLRVLHRHSLLDDAGSEPSGGVFRADAGAGA